MHSTVIKRSVVVDGHKTSVSLEDEFWKGLKEIAVARSATLSDLVAMIDHRRERGNLSSSLRLFVLESFQQRAVRGQDDDPGRPVERAALGQSTRASND
jgi:predicted DNA-binding ribbon-helix-helix protein